MPVMRRKDEAPDMLAAALGYLERGWSILPCCVPHPDGGCRQSGGKHGRECPSPGKAPLLSWKEYQTRPPTESEVKLWFNTWPNANIALATGAVSDVVVLDADSSAAVAFALEQGEGELSSTPTVTTGKGAHFYLGHPGEEVRNFAHKLPGIDFRGDGGYVLLPPSLHYSGRRYAWQGSPEDFGGCAEVPEWLMSKLKGRSSDSSEPAEQHERLDLSAFVDGIGEGARNDMLWRLAGKLRDQDIDLELAKLMVIGAAERCNPPYDVDEALAMLERAYDTYEPSPKTLKVDWEEEDDDEVARADDDEDGDPYPFITLDEFLSIEDEDEDWLIDGLVAGGSLNWFYADSGVGKTLIAAWYMLHIAAGRPLQGREVIQGTTMFVSEDTGARIVRKYLRRLKNGGGFPSDLPIVINPHPKGLTVMDDKDVQTLTERIEKYDPKLVVLDACESLVPSKDYKSIEYVHLRKLIAHCRKRGTAIIMIDHCNKGKGEGGSKPKPSMNRIFGSQAKQRDIDFAVEFNGSFKDGGAVRATWTKQRDEPSPDYTVVLKPGGFDAFSLEIEADISLKDMPEEERLIFGWLELNRGEWFTTAEISDGIGQAKRSVQRYLRSLVVKSIVQMEEVRGMGSRTVRYRSLPDVDELGTVRNG